ncbi:MAG: energy transducer TonB [Bacteroidales bacterium]|nr:energy transducer TonB [Bacteroidales bacterium]
MKLRYLRLRNWLLWSTMGLFVTSCNSCQSQNEKVVYLYGCPEPSFNRNDSTTVADDPGDEIYLIPDVECEFPGGTKALYTFFADNIHYPEQALKEQIEGKIYLSLIIEKDGTVSEIKLLRDIGGGCGKEAVRVAKMMPQWKPALVNNKPARSRFNIPFYFHPDPEIQLEKNRIVFLGKQNPTQQ